MNTKNEDAPKVEIPKVEIPKVEMPKVKKAELCRTLVIAAAVAAGFAIPNLIDEFRNREA